MVEEGSPECEEPESRGDGRGQLDPAQIRDGYTHPRHLRTVRRYRTGASFCRGLRKLRDSGDRSEVYEVTNDAYGMLVSGRKIASQGWFFCIRFLAPSQGRGRLVDLGFSPSSSSSSLHNVCTEGASLLFTSCACVWRWSSAAVWALSLGGW